MRIVTTDAHANAQDLAQGGAHFQEEPHRKHRVICALF